MKTIAFFNNRGGIGKTALVYHLSHMYANLGVRVITADFDPQSSLTSMFLTEDRLERLWADNARSTVFGALEPLLNGTGDVARPHCEEIRVGLQLIPGDLTLSLAEDELSAQWPGCLDRKERAFRVISSLWRLLALAAVEDDVPLVLIDVGPSLGSLNRAAMIAADHIVVPLAPDPFSLQGLRNLGPTLQDWRNGWVERKARNPVAELRLPVGEMRPSGYVVMQHAVRLDRPVRAYGGWMERIPGEYLHSVLGKSSNRVTGIGNDPHCLATLKHYRSLMPLAQEARKPMFELRPGDGAIGGHSEAVQECYRDFEALARSIAASCGLVLP